MPGTNYGAAIVDAIDECGVFVLILSHESNNSGQVVREAERAASSNSVIIPVRVEPVQPSRALEFYVSSSHWLDAIDKPLEKHLGALVAAIQNWQTRDKAQTPSVPEAFRAPMQSVRQRRPALVIGGIIIVLVLVGFAALLGLRNSSRSRASSATNVAASSQTASASAAESSSNPAAASPIIQRVIASSELKPQMYLGQLRRYGSHMAFDGDETTAWIPNGSGPGEWIEVYFREPTAILSLSVYGGYGADAERYRTNNRVRELRVIFPNGNSRVFELADKMQFQRFELPKHPVLRSIKFEIVSVYRGTKYDATPISEIAFNRTSSE